MTANATRLTDVLLTLELFARQAQVAYAARKLEDAKQLLITSGIFCRMALEMLEKAEAGEKDTQ